MSRTVESEISNFKSGSVPAGYKQTEVGVIPNDWEVKRLGNLGDIVRGGSPRPAGDPRYLNGDFIPWLTVAALTNIPEHQLKVRETFGCLTEEGAKRSRELREDTLIVANSGATLGVAKLVGMTCCANDGIAAIINQHSGERAFLSYFINTKTKFLREVVATGNGQPNLNTGLIREICVPFPPPSEQHAIATALSDVDALLGALNRLIAKKRDLKQAAMQQLLTGQTRLPGFHGEWEVKRLREVGKFLKGGGVTKDQTRSGTLACVRYGELYTLHNDVVRDFQSWISPEVAATAVRLEQGDILFAGSGETKEEIGKCAAFVSDIEAYAGGDIVILRPDDSDSVFLGYYLNTARSLGRRRVAVKVMPLSTSAVPPYPKFAARSHSTPNKPPSPRC